jgi:hypothetical protein
MPSIIIGSTSTANHGATLEAFNQFDEVFYATVTFSLIWSIRFISN